MIGNAENIKLFIETSQAFQINTSKWCDWKGASIVVNYFVMKADY